jgi:cation:H+ antiporter
VLIALELLSALVLLVVASDAFTNAVEWVGSIFGLTRSAMGSVVAAIGSSLPETMVAIVAILVLRDPASQAVGIGAILGAPFMLSTVVFALIGFIAIVRRKPSAAAQRLNANLPASMFGLMLFGCTFALAVGASFAPSPTVRFVTAALVLAAYGVHLTYHIRRKGAHAEDSPPPLRLAPRATRPPVFAVLGQLALALGVTIAASHWFVTAVTAASAEVGVPPLVVSLFLSPIATELPEMMNVVLWMRRGLDDLAVGNVLGAMIFQTSVASAIGLIATPWRLDLNAYVACGATLVAVALVLAVASIRRCLDSRSLALCGLFYAVYISYAFAHAR